MCECVGESVRESVGECLEKERRNAHTQPTEDKTRSDFEKRKLRLGATKCVRACMSE